MRVLCSHLQVVTELAKEAKSVVKAKAQAGDMHYPSEFVMEDVLEACGSVTLHGDKLNRR